MEGEKGYKRGLWTEEEDNLLLDYVKEHGKGRWNRIAIATALKRCGKSCRLRWINHLSPSIKHGDFSEEEDDLIIRLHNLLGNRWSLIAGRVPGRTDNQVKNHWNCHLSKKLGGIKSRQKRTKKQCSSQIKATEQVENIISVPMNTRSDIFSSNFVQGEGETGIENGSPWDTRIFETIEGNENESSDNPFLYCNDFPDTNSPSLVELWDPCTVDFVWQ